MQRIAPAGDAIPARAQTRSSATLPGDSVSSGLRKRNWTTAEICLSAGAVSTASQGLTDRNLAGAQNPEGSHS